MRYISLQKKYVNDVQQKFKKQYSIDLGAHSKNLYIRLKYIYNNYIGAFFAYIFIKLIISANIITCLNGALGLFALSIFSFNFENFKIIGLIIFFSKNILDNVDGFVARFKNETSKLGDKLDLYSAYIYHFAVLISLAINNFYQSNEIFILIILLMIIFLDIFNPMRLKKLKKNLKNSKKKISTTFLYTLFRFTNYDGRTTITDMIILILILEIFFKIFILSKIILILFLTFKFLRNIFYLLNFFKKLN